MRVKLNTPDRLIAGEVPWMMGILLFGFTMTFVSIGIALVFAGEWTGLIFGVVGGGMGFLAICVFVERLQLILDRPSGVALLRRRTILKHSETRLALAEVEKAIVETTRSRSNKRRILNRPTLVLTTGTRPITEVYSNARRTPELVRDINTWLGVGTMP